MILLLKQCGALALLSQLHEDVAMVTAGLMVAKDGMSPVLAGVVLYVAAIAGDLGIYLIGAGARRIGWLNRLVIGPNVDRIRGWLDRHFLRVVLVSRFVPGVLFPSYVTCGWLGFPIRRFMLTTMTIDALYTAVVFSLLLTFGSGILRSMGYTLWAVIAVLLVVVSVVRARRPHWGLMDRATEVQPVAAVFAVLKRQWQNARGLHQGMPGLASLRRKVGRAEYVPPLLFYVPFCLYWLWLALRYRSITLPSAANSDMECGGFWGESKSRALRQIGAEHASRVADFVTLQVATAGNGSPETDCERALVAMRDAGLEFPVVVKPDIGWQGFGVRLVSTADCLREYFALYPKGETVILQRYVPWDGEAGVLYVRMPGEEKGRVVSLTLRYFPFVAGDGKSTLRELILRDERARFKSAFHLGRRALHSGLGLEDLDRIPSDGEVVRLAFIGSIRVGGLYRDARAEITPAMSDSFDAISRSMSGLHFGRFDIRFESLERLKEGVGFSIFEVNGAGAEAIHVWDPEITLREVYRSLFSALHLLFKIGDLNRARGMRPCSLWSFLGYARRQYKLVVQYPPSA